MTKTNCGNRCITQLMKYSVIKIMKMIKVKKIRTQCNGILISNKKRMEEQTADTYSNMDGLQKI